MRLRRPVSEGSRSYLLSLVLLFALATVESRPFQPSRTFSARSNRHTAADHNLLTVLRGGGDRSYDYYADDDPYRRPPPTRGPPSAYAEADDRYGRARDDDPYEEYPSRGYYDEQEGYYDDRGAAPSRPRRESSSSSMLPSILKKGDRRIGLALLSSGAVVTFLGISLFFNKTLMRLGNLLFIAGVPMTLGPSRTMGYFLSPKKARATACLALGIFLVFIGWPIFGIILEVFGLLNLFGNMFPFVMAIVKQMPIVGALLNGNNNGRAPSRPRYREEDDYYYDDDGRRRDDDRYY